MVDAEELRLAIQHMKHLEKLEVELNTSIEPVLQMGRLKELTLHVSNVHPLLCDSWIEMWMKNHCRPCNFNLIMERYDDEEETAFLELLSRWNFKPQGYISHFKLYHRFEVPLNLFPMLPEYQLEVGKTVVHPFIKAKDVGITGLDWDIIVLTDTLCNGKRASIGSAALQDIFDYEKFMLNKKLDSFTSITEFNCKYSDTSFGPDQLEQLALACPKLQRLNLQGNSNCLHSLQGLRAIVSNCPDLCGLNLMDISVELVESHLGLWELLSRMKLTHLLIDTCMFCGDSDEQKLVFLFQKCSSLQALQIECFYWDYNCELCEKCEINWSLLFHFSALKYCRFYPNHFTVIQDVINSCKQLTIVSCNCFNSSNHLLISSVSTSSLQQLCISEVDTNIPDIFMETVSVHGGLVHVDFEVNSVSSDGITSLVNNSPELMTCRVSVQHFILRYNSGFVDFFKASFNSRKLFKAGRFYLFNRGEVIISGGDPCCKLARIFSLWPYDKICDLF